MYECLDEINMLPECYVFLVYDYYFNLVIPVHITGWGKC